MAKKKNIRTYQRGNTWTYSFETARVGGKRKPVTKGGFASEADAYNAGMTALANYVNGLKSQKDITLSYGDFLSQWINEVYIHEVKETTWVKIRQHADRHIIPALGHIKLVDLTPMHIKSFLNTKLTYSKKSLEAFKLVLTRSLDAAKNDYGYIPANPAKGVPIPRVAAPEKEQALTAEEQEALLRYFVDPTERVAIMLGLHCGLRISEAFAITWEDIDFDKQVIHITKQLQTFKGRLAVDAPKSRASVRDVHIDDTLCVELKKLRKLRLKERLKSEKYPDTLLFDDDRVGKLRDFDFIFRTPTGSLYRSEVFRDRLKGFKAATGINAHFHRLRKTHCTDLIASGAPIKAVQKRLGHSNMKTTLDIYTSVSDSMDKQLNDILNNHLYAK